MKASDLLVKCLEHEGVEYIFGIPGEENLDFMDSLSRSSIRFVLTRHEQAAGFMASTYGRLTGKPRVCLATLGPGAMNLVTAAAFATLGGMPMVMLTGQKPIRTSKQGKFQILNVVDVMLPLTKLSRQIESADLIPSDVREAFRLAQEERPGSTHLELPEDIAREESDRDVLPIGFSRRPVADAEAINRAAELLANAKAPMLLIGAGANRKQTCRELRELIDQTGMAFATTQMGKGVVSDAHDSFLGNAALSSNDFVHRAIDAADVILNVGHDVVEKPPFVMVQGGRQVIHLNYTAAEVDPVYFPQLQVVGDIADSIVRMTTMLKGRDVASLKGCQFFRKVQSALRDHVNCGSDDDRFPMYPQRLVADVRSVMPADGIIALDNGIYKIWFARNYPAYQPGTVLLDNALASMGAGLPSAMAAKLVHANRKVLAICGDGGFQMSSPELETAVRLKLDLVILVVRDNALGMIQWKQQQLGLKNYGLEFGNPDFVQLAHSYGAAGHRAESADAFTGLLEEAFSAGGVHIIDVPIDYSENDFILHDEIAQLSKAV